MKVALYRTGRPFTEKFMENFQSGFMPGEAKFHTYDEYKQHGLPNADIHCFFGILRGMSEIFLECEQKGIDHMYIDHAYLKGGYNPPFWFRIVKNGHCHNKLVARPDDRFQQYFKDIKLQPWRSTDGHILVCPPTNAMLEWFKIPNWYEETITEIRKHTDRPIKVREKPFNPKIDNLLGFGLPTKGGGNAKKVRNDTSLQEDLENAHSVVTFNSQVATDAVIKGIPTFIYGGVNGALPVAHTDFSKIENPIHFDNRQQWLNHLAYCQFTDNEFRSGVAFRISNQ